MVTDISRQICQKVEFWHSKWPPGGHLGSEQHNFCVEMGPMGIHPHTKFGLPILSHYENFPPKLIQSMTDGDNGRKVNAIARWSFGPSGLKTVFDSCAIFPVVKQYMYQ